MAKTLLEAYAKRISYADKYATQKGTPMTQQKKVLLAKVLNNTDRFLNESFTGTQATQFPMADMKKFCLNLTTLAVPSLIAPEIVLTQPMSSRTGYLAYVRYVAGTDKGGIVKYDPATRTGDEFNTPWGLGQVGVDRANYTSASVVESFTGDGTEDDFALAFPHVMQVVSVTVDGAAQVAGTDFNTAEASGITTVTFTTAPASGKAIKVAYVYDNVTIPQEAPLPVYNAVMDGIALTAKARRIAIRYSQLAAFEAKNDYGFDMQQQLAAQAVAELAFEIDTEVVLGLDEAAGQALPALKWNILRPQYISKADHYEGFAEVLEAAKAIMFDRTRKFVPDYMVASSKVLRVLPFIKGWSPASVGAVNGPYLAGDLNGVKVYISPSLAEGRFFLGVNQSDFLTSAAVYAPYMAVTPTMLLQGPDGATTQGFSTLYDFQILNKDLLVAGEITEDANYTEGTTSSVVALG